MRRIIIYTILLFVSIAAKATETSSLTHWKAGNDAYTAKDYNKAIEEYRAIINNGEYSVELYYNLANAYFKVDSIGKAILYYNKALRVDPSQEDVLYNLSLAEARTRDEISEVPEFFLNRWMRTLRNTMSCMTWSVLSLVMLGLLLVSLLVFLLASSIGLRKTGFFGALITSILFISTTAFAISSRNDMLSHDEAIVISSAISVRSSPDIADTELFILHEGTKVKITSEVDNWVEIVIADGKKGWIENKHIESI